MKRRNTTENRPLNEGEAMMNQINISIRTFMIIMGLFLILTENAYAYIDPGTGSYLFQMLMAGLLGSLFALKMAWRNIKTYLSQYFSKSATHEHEGE